MNDLATIAKSLSEKMAKRQPISEVRTAERDRIPQLESDKQRIFPSEWKMQKASYPKGFWVDIVDASYPGQCSNCGGRQVMIATGVESGPYQYFPTTVPEGMTVLNIPEANGWVIGRRMLASCPVCSGNETPKYLRQVSGLQPAELEYRITGFKPIPGKENAREAALQLFRGCQNTLGFVTFWGLNGRGNPTFRFVSSMLSA